MKTRRIVFAWALGMAVAAGCQGLEHNPALPGGVGGVGGSSGEGDGGQNPDPDGGASSRISGHVCLLTDTRDPTLCAFGDMSRYRVTDVASGASASTDINGRFELRVDAAAQLDLSVETDGADIDIVPALVPVPGEDGLLLPVVAAQTFLDLIDLLGVPDPGVDTSTLFVYVFDGMDPVSQVDLRDPGASSGVYYDEDLELSGWALGGLTGSRGAIMALGVDPENDSILLGLEGFEKSLNNIPFEPQTMTMVEVDFIIDPVVARLSQRGE